MKIIFMGTPMFAVKILEKLYSQHEIMMVITQPDQASRKGKLLIPPVKTWAMEHQLLIKQPEKIATITNEILNMPVDLIVTAAYGQFIPQKIIDFPTFRSINVHGSLLPKFRGGAPIQRAIINAEKESGISIIRMVKKMDAGNILAKQTIPILQSDNTDSMFTKLSELGADMILPLIDQLAKGDIQEEVQDENMVTFAYNLTKDDELLDFSKTATDCFNQIRGLCSNPGAYFQLDGLNIKVYNSAVSPKTTSIKPSVIIGKDKKSFEISCGENSVLQILEVQLPSGKRMATQDFLNGKGKDLIVLNKEIK
ncbi:MAG: methionyl-tRNA formyltransferase [Bacilli bacterium]